MVPYTTISVKRFLFVVAPYQVIANCLSSIDSSICQAAPSNCLAVACCHIGTCFTSAWCCLANDWVLANQLIRSNKQTKRAWRKWWCMEPTLCTTSYQIQGNGWSFIIKRQLYSAYDLWPGIIFDKTCLSEFLWKWTILLGWKWASMTSVNEYTWYIKTSRHRKFIKWDDRFFHNPAKKVSKVWQS